MSTPESPHDDEQMRQRRIIWLILGLILLSPFACCGLIYLICEASGVNFSG